MGGAVRTLAIDTSGAAGGVAALDGGRVAELTLDAPGDHARLVAAALVEVAGRLGWAPRDAELVAVVRGPGSFTGLRVGVATAKAIAWTGGARLLGVSAAEVIARRAARGMVPCPTDLAIAFDAGRDEVFACAATADAASPTGWAVGPGTLVNAADWIASLPAGSHVAGPAATARAVELLARGVVVAPADTPPSPAAAAGAIALLRAAAGETDDPALLVPDYIRPSYAEEPRPPAATRPAGRGRYD